MSYVATRRSLLVASARIPSTLLDSLVAYWKLNEASGTRYDSAGSSHLTDYNAVASASGRLGNCISFPSSNSNQYVGCADNAALSMGDIDFTIAGWFKKTGVNGQAQIANKWDWNLSSREYLLDYNPGTDCRFYVATAGQTQVGVTDVFDPAVGDWTFICGWHDSVNNQLGIQVNGRTVVTQSHSGGVHDGSSAFAIGAYSVPANYPTDIDIDEVGIWKRILTADERALLYNSGAGITYPF